MHNTTTTLRRQNTFRKEPICDGCTVFVRSSITPSLDDLVLSGRLITLNDLPRSKPAGFIKDFLCETYFNHVHAPFHRLIRVTWNGRDLENLPHLKIGDLENSTLDVMVRLRGGGGDGGSIPGRTDLVRTAKTHNWYVLKMDRDDPSLKVSAGWTMCQLTNQKLEEPVVADQLGRFYNRTAVMQYIVDGERKSHFKHLKSMKEVKEVKAAKAKSSTELGDHPLGWVCPITGKSANGNRAFFMVWGCGCLVSEEAFSQLGKTSCPSCGKMIDAELNEIIRMVPPENEWKSQHNNMIERNAVLKARKKAEKRKKKALKKDGDKKPTTKAISKAKAKNLKKDKIVKKVVKKRRMTDIEKEIQENLKKAKSSKVFSSMFISEEERKNDPRRQQVAFISTKPRSMNALM